MKIIDSHQHFWDPSRGDYHWMPKDNPILNRKYEVKDLSQVSESIDLHKTILVQAAATNAETEYMLKISENSDLVCGVVGWVNFEDKSQLDQLKIFAKHPKFLGVRPMIQDIPDENWVLNKNFDIFFKNIIDLDLSFDALGFPIHLENFYIIASRYPSLRFIIDHLMKPKICNNNQEEFIHWQKGIKKLSKLENVYCKFSGMATEACEKWTEQDLKPYVDEILNLFTDKKIMWGSDWPVCNLRTNYLGWYNSATNLTKELSLAERQNIFYNNAKRFYKLKI
ncbi:amidohydrolase family protein [Candidatus Pelagibacter sp.]|nr:amidohydrolase family protein [Candidatus Pelagibacter sp.]MDC1091925.1 amidohydrolase family protein [Candidatus Pelagibacter sp.]